MDFKLHYIGNRIVENPPFMIDRPEGSYRHIFFHFISSVKVLENGSLIDAPPGSCILYTPNHPQKLIASNTRLNHDYLDFTINHSDIFKALKIPVNVILKPYLSDYITNAIKEIQKERDNHIIGSDYMINSLITNLFVTLSRKIHHFSLSNYIYREDLKTRFEHIRLNVYKNPDEFSIEKMANMVDFSRSHFNLLYKDFFNVTPIQDLTNARIAKVKSLLISEKSLDVVTAKLGFDSVEYFFRWFKKHFNCTPTEFKIKENIE